MYSKISISHLSNTATLVLISTALLTVAPVMCRLQVIYLWKMTEMSSAEWRSIRFYILENDTCVDTTHHCQPLDQLKYQLLWITHLYGLDSVSHSGYKYYFTAEYWNIGHIENSILQLTLIYLILKGSLNHPWTYCCFHWILNAGADQTTIYVSVNTSIIQTVYIERA